MKNEVKKTWSNKAKPLLACIQREKNKMADDNDDSDDKASSACNNSVSYNFG